jgi:hypothetical protein
MRIYVVGTVMSVTEPITLKMQRGAEYLKATAIVKTRDEVGDNFLAIDVFGQEKIQRLIEAQTSGVPQDMVVTVASRQWEKDDGSKHYSTYLNLKFLLGSAS